MEEGFYWVRVFGRKGSPEIARWDDFWGQFQIGQEYYTEVEITVLGPRIIPPDEAVS